MKLYQRYFVYGSVFTSVAWGLLIYLYIRMQYQHDEMMSSFPNAERPHKRLQPRHDNLQPHDNFDFVYGQDKLENEEDGIVNIKRQPFQSTPARQLGKKELGELGIIRNNDDEKVRYEGE